MVTLVVSWCSGLVLLKQIWTTFNRRYLNPARSLVMTMCAKCLHTPFTATMVRADADTVERIDSKETSFAITIANIQIST